MKDRAECAEQREDMKDRAVCAAARFSTVPESVLTCCCSTEQHDQHAREHRQRTPLALGGHNLAPIDAPTDPAKQYLSPRIVAWRCQLCPLVIPHDGTPWQPWPYDDCPSAAGWRSTPRRQ